MTCEQAIQALLDEFRLEDMIYESDHRADKGDRYFERFTDCVRTLRESLDMLDKQLEGGVVRRIGLNDFGAICDACPPTSRHHPWDMIEYGQVWLCPAHLRLRTLSK